MIKSFFYTRKWALWAYGGLAFIIFLAYMGVQLLVELNYWYEGFYNLLQEADKYYENSQEGIALFFSKFVSIKYLTEGFEGEPSFLVIAMPYVAIYIFTNWFGRMYCLRWREAITFDYIPRWRNVTEEIEGASQRIQEDTQRFGRILEDIGTELIRGILTLISFVPILWILSEHVEIPFLKDIPGSLVWVAVIVGAGGIIISWFVGILLPGLEYNNQKAEAKFRKDLVYGEDDKENYANPIKLFELFTGVRLNFQRLYLHYGYFELWSISFRQALVVVPFLIMAPSLFTGTIMLGVVMRVNSAFSEVKESLNVFLLNWTRITELRSVFKRLNEFERNLDDYEITR